jgi:hypothetical protein
MQSTSKSLYALPECAPGGFDREVRALCEMPAPLLARTTILGPDMFAEYRINRDWGRMHLPSPSLEFPDSILTFRGLMAGEPFGPAIELTNTPDNIKFGIMKLYSEWFDSRHEARRYLLKMPEILMLPVILIHGGASVGVINSRNPRTGEFTTERNWIENRGNTVKSWDSKFSQIFLEAEHANRGPATISLNNNGDIISVMAQQLPLAVNLQCLTEMRDSNRLSPIDFVASLEADYLATFSGHRVSDDDCTARIHGLPSRSCSIFGQVSFVNTEEQESDHKKLVLFIDRWPTDVSIFERVSAVVASDEIDHIQQVASYFKKPCVRVPRVQVNFSDRTARTADYYFKEGDKVFIDGNLGLVQFVNEGARLEPQFQHGNLSALAEMVKSQESDALFSTEPVWVQWRFAKVAARLRSLRVIR